MIEDAAVPPSTLFSSVTVEVRPVRVTAVSAVVAEDATPANAALVNVPVLGLYVNVPVLGLYVKPAS